MNKSEPLKKVFGGIIYTFHREDCFYPIILNSDDEVIANVECNPGTLKVVNEFTGETIYEKP